MEKALGEVEIGKVGDTPVISWKHIKSNRLNQALVKKLYPEVHAECIDVSVSRRFAEIENTRQDDE